MCSERTPVATMPQLLPDDELLDVPLGNLLPGELARSFKVHAAHTHKADEVEALHATQRLEQRTVEDTRQEEEEALHRREEVVLVQIAEREEMLREEAERLDDRAIKLHDGRRAYVDGDGYRDAEGRELTGADRAQAEVLHLEQPQAATWQEKRQIDQAWAETEKSRRSIEAAQAGNPGTNEASAVSAAEKMLSRSRKIDALPDYGTIDLKAGAPSLQL